MKVLSTGNKLLFVENAYTFKDAIAGVSNKNKVDLKQAFGLKSRITTIPTENGGKVYLLTPPLTLPITFLPTGSIFNFLLRINGRVLRASIKKALKELDMAHELINFTSFNPAMGAKTGRTLGEKTLIYHCYDEIKGAPLWNKKHGVELEQVFMKMADAVIVTSQGLYESKKDECRRCYIVKNAVKAELFRKGFVDKVQDENKTVGYVGTIDDRFDLELLQFLFTTMPQIEFVFVGRIVSERTEAVLRQFINVKLEGAKQPDDLPPYLKTFSAAIIPFKSDDLTRGIYPMKINEYLAAGLPVVSTRFGDLSDFESVIRIADGNESFEQYLNDEIITDSSDKRKTRLELAEGNTWEKRAGELSAVIEQVEQEVAAEKGL